MARQARLDFTGAVHHVLTRGVARGAIFLDDQDRETFLKYLEDGVLRSAMRCYAGALIPNHVHLVLRTGREPLGRSMHRLLTRYAVYFNHRHHRDGHLFQNRYKAILGEADSYLLELVRYVHLNPVRAGLVEDLQALGEYPWTGHRAVLGRTECDWQDTDLVLNEFGRDSGRARERYLEYLAEGLKEGEGAFGGRLEEGSATAVVGAAGPAGRDAEPRVLGSGRYVEQVLKEVEARDRRRAWLGKRLTPDDVIARAARMTGATPAEVRGHTRRAPVAQARCLACKWLVEDMGLSQARVAEILAISRPGVSRCVLRGRKAEKDLGVVLEGT